MNPQKIKTVSTLTLRKQFGTLTNEVLYGNVILKVTKNGTKALLIKSWEETDGIDHQKRARADDLMKRIRKIAKENSKRTKLINGMSWSEFIQKDRYAH